MVDRLQSPTQATYWLIPGTYLVLVIHILGVACFCFIIAKRMMPLLRAERDLRFDQPLLRLERVLKYWLGQWKHPRYRGAGILHILIFAGFILLATRAFSVLILATPDEFLIPGLSGAIGAVYSQVTDYAATIVFLCMVVAVIRRVVFRPPRYNVPARHGKAHLADAVFLLLLIAALMVADSLFAASKAAAENHVSASAIALAPASMSWTLQRLLASTSFATLQNVFLGSYLIHNLTFYFLLCYRPFGIQFHVETSLFAIYFSKLDREALKPVRWGVSEENLDKVGAFGVKTFEDFTWKHMLDFYSCADCGRCSDNCPANAAGRPLSPRFLSIKARDFSFQHYPILGRASNHQALIGSIYSADEIWSCTTCGACEEECPLLVEYIDKIVDLRRGLIDDGNVPQTLQKPLKALESRGNPYGKMEKKRAEWTQEPAFKQSCCVKTLNGKNNGADVLYFVDSTTSYDDRMQSIARSTAKILEEIGENFGILGSEERDSGHEVRRFGEETLFLALRDRNSAAIRASGVHRIITSDPHAYNALKRDYRSLPTVEHISQTICRNVQNGRLRFRPLTNSRDVYAYHDPCYLGRHNQIYDDPRTVLDAIPDLKRVEMKRSRDRSFCCGGGGLMLFYEPKEEERIGVHRVRMAAEVGASVIVTACPFCLANLEDAIKVAGMEDQMTAIDLAELVAQQLSRKSVPATE
jgi:Fe-S oxidoreductase